VEERRLRENGARRVRKGRTGDDEASGSPLEKETGSG